MSTQPTQNGSQMQYVPLEAVHADPRMDSRWDYILAELPKLPPKQALKITFAKKVLVAQCAIGIRSLKTSRALNIGIKQKHLSVYLWNL